MDSAYTTSAQGFGDPGALRSDAEAVDRAPSLRFQQVLREMMKPP